MKSGEQTALTKLDRVTATVVHLLGSVGLFHYNKLTYLFEYFHIKNFGLRYTKDYFIKLPHGPVITNYKKQIINLHKKQLVAINEEELTQKRKLEDDYYYSSVQIESTGNTGDAVVQESLVYSLINQTVLKFGNLSINELEAFVYETEPVKKYLRKAREGFKKPSGGYVLKGDCLRMRDHDNAVTRGRKIAQEHLQKYPNIDFAQQRIHAEELSTLALMRPHQ